MVSLFYCWRHHLQMPSRFVVVGLLVLVLLVNISQSAPARRRNFHGKRDCTHTTITASKSAVPLFESTKTYDWGVTKTLVSGDNTTLASGACVTSQYVVNAKRTLVSQSSAKYLQGNITVCNTGAYPTENLQINDVIQLKCWVAPQGASTPTAQCAGTTNYGSYNLHWTDSNHVYPIDLGTKTSLAPSECHTWSYQLDLSLISYYYSTTAKTYAVTDNICDMLSDRTGPLRPYICTDCDQIPICLLNNTARITITNYLNYVPGCGTNCDNGSVARQAPDTSIGDTTETSGDILNTEAPPTTLGGSGGGGDTTQPTSGGEVTQPPSDFPPTSDGGGGEFTFPPTTPPPTTAPPTPAPCISNCPGPELCPYGPGYGLGGVFAFVGAYPLSPTSLTEINENAQITDNSITGPGLTCTQMPGGDIEIPGDLCVASTPNDMNCTLFADCCNTAMTCDTWSSYEDFVQLSVVGETTQLSRYSNHAGPITIYSGACPGSGCTLSIGYWKTHAGFTGKNVDRITQFLPLTIGCPPAQYLKGANVTSATQAVSILSFGALLGGAKNGLNKLAAQLLAAKLNILNGASHSSTFDATVATANGYLCSYGFNPGSWNSLSNSVKSSINNVMSTLDQYNNGVLAGEPSHCE